MEAGGERDDMACGQVPALLALIPVNPAQAMARAKEILAGDPDRYEASVAHQAIGILLRDWGDLDAALAELRSALLLARACGSAAREADVLATLGVALVYRGRSRRGLAALDASLQLANGQAAGHVLVRRGISLLVLGRHPEALADLRRAVRILRSAGDTIWEARALTARALI